MFEAQKMYGTWAERPSLILLNNIVWTICVFCGAFVI